MILSVCAALITIDDNSCYFIVNIFRSLAKFLMLQTRGGVCILSQSSKSAG